ncbi:DUF6242 domain-containing protein [Parabacteroides sp. AM08-6]|uniref:DUF6242 domain-containing protein n=1 Tax=Parabacteroides sp. AM08-6 TaxID=2292053 RepID=UPI000F00D048|nr:DUF6242 domain-containing protein [Parabacteroides sp. AM08-6]RHJ86525.1 exo-alpha-sialidase [Parabacteroides sp. AM08-6]
MKKKLVLFITGCFVFLLSSCLGSNEIDYELSKDCQILTFSLSSDSVPELKNVVFTIDQINGLIFNADSMPYGTELKDKVICTVNLATTVWGCQVIQEAIGDTISWNLQDSLDFSKPVQFINTLWDGETTKKYTAQLNIHQVVPDSMVWTVYSENIAGEAIKEEKTIVFGEEGSAFYYMYMQPVNASKGYLLYRSAVSDGRNWEPLSLTGLPADNLRLSQIDEYEGNLYVITTDGLLYRSANGTDWTLVEGAPSIKTLLGSIKVSDDFTGSGKQQSAMAAIVDQNGVATFARMDKSMEWKSGNTVSAGFPMSGFGNVSYNSMFRAYLMVVAGRTENNSLTNTVWGTSDGLVWANFTDEETETFSVREGVSVIQYDNRMFMVGGIDAAGKASSEIYMSQDYGVTWNLSDTLTVMPPEFKARGYASIYVDKDNYMYLFGGKETTSSNVLDQIWRGRINRLGFKD